MFKSWENLVWVGCFFPDINGSMGTLKFWSTRYWSMAVGFVIGPEIWHLGRLGPFICIIYQQLPFCSYQFCSQTLYIYIVAWSSEITVSRPPMADSIVFDYINISISIWLLSHLYHINTQFYHVIPHLYHIYIYILSYPGFTMRVGALFRGRTRKRSQRKLLPWRRRGSCQHIWAKWLQVASTKLNKHEGFINMLLDIASTKALTRPGVAHDGAFTKKWMPIQLDSVFWSSNVSHTNSERLLVRKLDRTHPQAHRY